MDFVEKEAHSGSKFCSMEFCVVFFTLDEEVLDVP